MWQGASCSQKHAYIDGQFQNISQRYLRVYLKLTIKLLFPKLKLDQRYSLQFTWTDPNTLLSAKELISATFTQAQIWQLCYLKPQDEYKQLPKLKGAKVLMICAKFLDYHTLEVAELE